MAPLFNPGALGKYAAAMNEATHLALARMKDGDRVDLAHVDEPRAFGALQLVSGLRRRD